MKSLILFLTVSCMAFDNCEVEQLIYLDHYTAIIEINKIIRLETNPEDLKILREIKDSLMRGSMEDKEHIRNILKRRE